MFLRPPPLLEIEIDVYSWRQNGECWRLEGGVCAKEVVSGLRMGARPRSADDAKRRRERKREEALHCVLRERETTTVHTGERERERERRGRKTRSGFYQRVA